MVTASRVAWATLVGGLAVFGCVVLVRGDLPLSAVDLLLGNVAYLSAVVVLVVRGRRHRDQRPWLRPLAAGILAFVVGSDLYTFQVAAPGSLPVATLTTVVYLGVYPCFLAAVLTALRKSSSGLGRIVALDGVTGALAGAAVGIGAISPLLEEWDGTLTTAVSLVYPLGDVLLVAAALGALGVVGVRNGRHFIWWASGMVIFAVGDIVYAYLQFNGTYDAGSWLDGVWVLGCALMVRGAGTVPPAGGVTVPRTASSFAVALSSAVASVGVLVLAPVAQHGPLPLALALLALGGCMARFLLAFHQVRELAAVRVLALTDELTGVGNRRALYAELDQLFARDTRRAPGGGAATGFALLLVDLDHFKEVNDSLGHSAGDDLLRAVVGRFVEALGELGSPHLVSRLGGDEFAILLHDVGSREEAAAVAAVLSESLRRPVAVEGAQLRVRASTGVTVAPQDAADRSGLLLAADAAMYLAKSSGDSVSLYSPTAVGDRRQRLGVAQDLYAALERDELVVDYQPIVAADGRLAGAEALVRWDHPVRGRLSPDEFLDVAERYRLTARIAERVLDLALGDLARWRAGGASLGVSVNVSASDLGDQRLVDTVAAALLTHDLPPSALTIEVTESAMMRDPEAAHTVMTAIADLGVRLSVDDYGTGYSSLDYLLRLPIDEIKLDREFSAHLVGDVRSLAIVRSTIDLTHGLGLHMVAEGVEDEQTLAVLRDLGCDLVQGWHLGRPVCAEVFADRLRAGSPAPPQRQHALSQ